MPNPAWPYLGRSETDGGDPEKPVSHSGLRHFWPLG
jgi:hypothetical protein